MTLHRGRTIVSDASIHTPTNDAPSVPDYLVTAQLYHREYKAKQILKEEQQDENGVLLEEDVICAKCKEHSELWDFGTYCCGAGSLFG